MLGHLRASPTRESYLWIGMNLIDLILTSIGLVFGAVEANFAIRFLGINAVWELIIWKIVLVLGVLAFLGRIKIPYAKNENILFLVNRLMICVCVWNAIVILIVAIRG